MPANEIKPRRELFTRMLQRKGATQSKVAARLSISVNTLRTLLNGNLVTRGTIEHLAEKLKLPISSLIVPSPDAKIPQSSEFYENLHFGWFIDHDRQQGGAAAWYREEISLHFSNDDTAPFKAFHGMLKNDRWGEFKLRAFVLNDYHFSLMAVAEHSFSGFTAGFSKCVSLPRHPARKEGILCGTWNGIDHLASRLAVYRMFLSSCELSLDDLHELTRLTPIERVLDGDTLVGA